MLASYYVAKYILVFVYITTNSLLDKSLFNMSWYKNISLAILKFFLSSSALLSFLPSNIEVNGTI